MDKETKLGMNRTGIDASPIDAKKMIEGIEKLSPPLKGSQEELAENRKLYISESGPSGSVPVPGTIKGVVKAGMQKLKGNSPTILIDKLGERLAFERTGVRIYDALISKHEGTIVPLERLKHFRDEEHEHFMKVAEVMRRLGADPTADTPCANVSFVASSGIPKVVTEPRMNFLQSLEAVLIAELSDNAGWEMLIGLCEDAGLTTEAEEFRECLKAEQEHLTEVRGWVEQLTKILAGAERGKQEVA